MSWFVKKTAYKLTWWKRGMIVLGGFLGGVLMFSRQWRISQYLLDIKINTFTVKMGIVCDLICFLGLTICVWARHTIAGNWSSNVTFKENHELIQKGPYRYVRHPIYTGVLLMLASLAPILGTLNAYLAILVFFAVYWYKLRQEEILLTQHFPKEYPEYQSRVKALIPFIF